MQKVFNISVGALPCFNAVIVLSLPQLLHNVHCCGTCVVVFCAFAEPAAA